MRAGVVLMLGGVLAIGAAALAVMPRDRGPRLSGAARELLALCDEFDPWPPGGYPCVRVWTDHWAPIDAWLLDRSAGTCLVRTGLSQSVGLPIPDLRGGRGYASWEFQDVAPSTFTDLFAGKHGWLQRVRWMTLRADRADGAAFPAKGEHLDRGLLRILGAAFAEKLRWDFGDPRCSWRELLTRHDRWLERFGEGADERDRLRVTHSRDSILGALAQLEALPGPGQPHSPDQLVTGLLSEFAPRLGINLHLDTCPLPVPRERTRPTDAILAAGLECVVDLILALDDKADSRLIGQLRIRGMESETLLPVPLGDLAHLALTEMAGGSPEGLDPREREAHWNRWYQEARRRGLRVMLEERVAKREPFAMVCFARQYPDDAAQVFAAAHRGDPQDEATLWLVLRELPGRVPDALVAEFVDRVQLLPNLDVALPGLWRLVEEGHPEIVLRALDHWRTLLRVPGMAENGLEVHDWLALGRAAGCWREVWTALAEIGATAKGRLHLERFLRWHPSPTYLRPLAEDPIAREPLRTCLRALLAANDREFAQEHTFVCRGVPVVVLDATIADLAEWALAEFWPDQPPFDARRTSSVRARLREAGGEPLRNPANLPANLVQRVEIDAALPAGNSAALRALQGGVLTRPALLAALRGYLRPRAARRGRVEWPDPLELTLERTGLGDGLSLRARRLEPEPGPWPKGIGVVPTMEDRPTWLLDVSIVVAGRRFHRSAAHLDWRDWIADGVEIARRKANPEESAHVVFVPEEIDAALALPATTGFEMRLTLHEDPR